MENKLINSGYSFINFDLNEKRKFKTYIVLGLGRSGTSMVAGALHNLGIYMGDNLGHTYEDPLLSGTFERKDFESAKKIIEEKNKNYSTWGWKRPSSINYLNSIEDMFEDVVFLVVWRDIFSIGNRNKISMEYDLFTSMENSLKSYTRLLSFVKNTKKPIVLISYEKAMLSKETFVDLLTTLNITENPIQKDGALNFITENPKEYLEASRITNAKGAVGKMNCNKINGWVFYPKAQNKTVRVNLLINGKIVEQVQADQLRKRLLEEGIHSSGLCGFEFANLTKFNINLGDEIIIMADNDIREIRNGKYIVTKDFFSE